MRVGGRGHFIPPLPLLTMFIEKLFPASSWRAFRNFKWPGFYHSLWSLHKNEGMHDGLGCVCGGGGRGRAVVVTLPQGRVSPSTTGKFCIWRLDFCQIIKSCSCFWMDHKSKQVCSLIDRFMTSEGSYTLILPFTSKTGQSVAQNRQKIF